MSHAKRLFKANVTQPKGLRVQHGNVGLFQMCPSVPDHVGLLRKAPFADVAGERSLFGVDSLVLRQVALLGKGLGTMRALEASIP